VFLVNSFIKTNNMEMDQGGGVGRGRRGRRWLGLGLVSWKM